jgi:hypothetical protein
MNSTGIEGASTETEVVGGAFAVSATSLDFGVSEPESVQATRPKPRVAIETDLMARDLNEEGIEALRWGNVYIGQQSV